MSDELDLAKVCRKHNIRIQIFNAWYDDNKEWPFIGSLLDVNYHREAIIKGLTYKQGIGFLGPALQKNTLWALSERKRVFQGRHPDMVRAKYWTKPTVADVMYSVLSDADPYIHGYSFLEWCDNHGMNNDSIKALEMYNQCVSTGRQLMKHMSMSVIEELAQAAQEY